MINMGVLDKGQERRIVGDIEKKLNKQLITVYVKNLKIVVCYDS